MGTLHEIYKGPIGETGRTHVFLGPKSRHDGVRKSNKAIIRAEERRQLKAAKREDNERRTFAGQNK